MIYVLFIIVNNYYGVTISQSEFLNRDACMAAAKAIAERSVVLDKGNNYKNPIILCAAKG